MYPRQEDRLENRETLLHSQAVAHYILAFRLIIKYQINIIINVCNGLIAHSDGAVLELGPLNFTDRARWHLCSPKIHSVEARDDQGRTSQ